VLNNRFTSTKGYKGEIGTSIGVGVKEGVRGEGSLCFTKFGPLETGGKYNSDSEQKLAPLMLPGRPIAPTSLSKLSSLRLTRITCL